MGKTVDIAKGRTVPLMSNREIDIVTKLMLDEKPKTVLEWGSGISTVYFPPRIPSVEKWVSIEHNPKWYNYIKNKVCSKVELSLKNKLDYYSEPVRLETKYDMIIVDGIYRRKCLVAAKHLLTQNGFVILHDSGREEYITAYRCYKTRKELCKGELPKGRGFYKHRGLMFFSDR